MFNSNALEVLRARYLRRDASGAVVEEPEEMILRVASAVSSVESVKGDRRKLKLAFVEMMNDRRFLPNSPTLMNAGKRLKRRNVGQLSACFVLPIEDDPVQVFRVLSEVAAIQLSGGGTGFNFSAIRKMGNVLDVIQLFDDASNVVRQSGVRRGANMAILNWDHPEVSAFVGAKRVGERFRNFNFSVGVSDAFMKGAAGQPLFDDLVDAAWASGDPGLIFLDRIEESNPTPKVGRIWSTNPCGEQPLLPYESCNLGSLNVSRYVGSGGTFNWVQFEEDVRLGIRFLDLVIDANAYPVEQCERITKANRKVGLGVMGFADALLAMGLRYESKAAVEFGGNLMRRLTECGRDESQSLAKTKGAFPNWSGSRWHRLGLKKLRNATVSTVAPSGTISILAGCSSGIEPVFAAVTTKNVLDGRRLVETHPLAGDRSGGAWQTAAEVSVEGHVKMQAAFQKWSDSAVSKTINLPAEAERAAVREAYLLAFKLGCKGITVFRDRSKGPQVLECATC